MVLPCRFLISIASFTHLLYLSSSMPTTLASSQPITWFLSTAWSVMADLWIYIIFCFVHRNAASTEDNSKPTSEQHLDLPATEKTIPKPNKPTTSSSVPPIDKTTKPKSVFQYLEGVNSIECNIGASTSSTTNDADKPSTSTADVAPASRSKIKVVLPTRAGNDGNRTGGADSDVVEIDSQGECSETLEYDGSQTLFTE